MNERKGVFFCITILFSLTNAFSQISQSEKFMMDFRNQKISDIIYSLAEIYDESVVVDETVTGNISYHLEENNFENALKKLCDNSHLYLSKSDGAYFVSRIKISIDEKEKISINSEDVNIELFINTLSRKVNKTIMYDSLPNTVVSIRVANSDVEDILNLVLLKLPGFGLEKVSEGFYLSKTAGANNSRRNIDIFKITKKDDEYSLTVQKAMFSTILDSLFKKAEKEFSLLIKSSIQLENINYAEKKFDEVLRLLLEQGNCDYSVGKNGVYYIFEVQKKDVLKNLKEIKIVTLKNLTVDTLITLMPSELNSSSFMKFDKGTNTIVLNGSKSEIEPIISFIEKVDVLNVRENSVKTLKLSFIKGSELVKSIPSTISKENIQLSTDESIVFFMGSEIQFDEIKKIVSEVDIPKQQIRYQILVIQRQKTSGINWSTSYSESSTDKGYEKNHSVLLSNIFNMNFDVITNFGIQFAVGLNVELSNGKSHVLADTTLNGISGETITFSNTNTYRYRDIIVDTSGDLYTSTTREIASGLTLSINGWSSGDDMVTVKVDAQVSKQGSVDSSTDTTNPPSTSEKKVSTNIRSKSGEPVIIGGLFQQETDMTEKRIPFLGSIPFLGELFKSKIESKADTEFIIYLVPFVEKNKKGKVEVEANIERLVKKYLLQEKI